MPRRPTTSAPGSPRPRCSCTATPARRSAPRIAAFHLRIPVVHVEAGLRAGTGNRTPFPEELNRRLIARIASLHLAPTTTNQENLVRENIPIKQVFVTGNTAIDALRWASELDVPFVDPAVKAAYESDRRIVLVTAHRRENWGEGLRGIGEGVARLATAHPDVTFVLPLHPNPSVQQSLRPLLSERENVVLSEPMGYAEFARLLARCELVITDSGGIQEEAPALGKPVLVVRETSERVEGIEAGTLALVGTDPEKIYTAAHRLLTDREAYAAMSQAPNPYGDGHAAERIVGRSRAPALRRRAARGVRRGLRPLLRAHRGRRASRSSCRSPSHPTSRSRIRRPRLREAS